MGGYEGTPSKFKALLDFANNLGDMICDRVSGFLMDIRPDAGAFYTVLLAFRLISVVTWIALGLSLIYFLFDSNLLTSKLCPVLVGLLAGVGGLRGAGVTRRRMNGGLRIFVLALAVGLVVVACQGETV